MYWGDSSRGDTRLNRIESANFDGSDRVVLFLGQTINPFDIVIYGDTIIWSDWYFNQLVTINISNPNTASVMGPTFNRPGGLHVQYGK